MFDKIRKWREKREDRICIKNAFHLARSVLPYANARVRYTVIETISSLLNSYDDAWDDTDFTNFYRERLNYLAMKGE